MVLGQRARALTLKALSCTKNVDTKAGASFRELVVWLEDTKIRALPLEMRGPLRDIENANWNTAFSAFLKEVGCELNPTAENYEKILDYLLEQALSLDYRDNAGDLGSVVQELKAAHITTKPPPPKRQKVIRDKPVLKNLDDAEFQSKVRQLAVLLKVQVAAHANVEALVHACIRAAERFIQPFSDAVEGVDRAVGGGGIKDSGKRQGGQRGQPKTWGLSPVDFPSGIELKDPAVENAVSVLRVLYVNDLRVLQSAVDKLLVSMQDYTADPKTDSRLGRVGTG